MIDRAEAIERARQAIAAIPDPTSAGYTLVVETAEEHRFGWLFFYESREYLRTGELMHRLFGNAPLIVDRRDGRTTFVPTGRPLRDAIREYDEQWQP